MPDTTNGTRVERAAHWRRHLSGLLASATVARRVGGARDSIERLLESHADALSWEDRLALAELLYRAGRTAAARTLLDSAWSKVRIAGSMVDVPEQTDGWYFVSNLRPSARLLSATRLIRPGDPRLPLLLERIVSTARSDRRWTYTWTTQDYGASVPVIADALIEHGLGAPVSDATLSVASLARAPGGTTTGDSIRVRVPLPGDGRRFFAVSSREMPIARDASPRREGVVVERWIERYDNGEPVTVVPEGDIVRVRVRFTSSAPRDFVALVDPVPAGLEVIDLSLPTRGVLGPSMSSRGEGDADWPSRRSFYSWSAGMWEDGGWTPWEHREFRDDRVQWFARHLASGSHTVTYLARATTVGTFVHPPAHAEEMYNPGANGRSGAGKFRVIRAGSR